MRTVWGMMLAAIFAGACGTAQTTGTAKNGWDTPTGQAQATDQRYYNSLGATHAARDRSAFRAQAPTLQSVPPASTPVMPPADVPPADAIPSTPVPETPPDVTPPPDLP